MLHRYDNIHRKSVALSSNLASSEFKERRVIRRRKNMPILIRTYINIQVISDFPYRPIIIIPNNNNTIVLNAVSLMLL